MRALSSLSVLLVAALLLGSCVTSSPVPTLDTSYLSALAPACAGQSVAGSGKLTIDGAALNHLVLLDRSGAPFAWTDWTPPEWRPGSLADAELVACLTGNQETEQVQVCPYYGGDITRYRVTETLKIIEPSTGRSVSTVGITAEPRTCKPHEYAGMTEIKGEIDEDLVKAYLAGFVEHGRYVAPSSASPVTASVEPGASPASHIPTATTETAELRQALATGQISVSGAGNGLASLDLTVTSHTDVPLTVTISAGTLFEPGIRRTQTMVALWDDSVDVDPGATETTSIGVACVQMHQDQPTSDDSFTVSSAAPDADLQLLLAEPTLAEADGRVRQFAVWTITSNPKQNDYVPLGGQFDVFGSGPDDKELEQIQALFDAAGIDTSKYRALP